MSQTDSALPELDVLDIRGVHYTSRSAAGYLGFILHDTDFGGREPRALWLDTCTKVLSIAFNDKSTLPVMHLEKDEADKFYSAYASFCHTGERATLGIYRESDFLAMRDDVMKGGADTDKLDEFESRLKALPKALKIKMRHDYK